MILRHLLSLDDVIDLFPGATEVGVKGDCTTFLYDHVSISARLTPCEPIRELRTFTREKTYVFVDNGIIIRRFPDYTTFNELAVYHDGVLGRYQEISWIAAYNSLDAPVLISHNGWAAFIRGTDFKTPPLSFKTTLAEVYDHHGVPYTVDNGKITPL